MWFTDIASREYPGRDELILFVDGTMEFLNFVLTEDAFDFLWKEDPELRDLATETFQRDLSEGSYYLKQAIGDIPDRSLMDHGLIGRPMHFKLRVIDSISRNWENRFSGQFSVSEWLKKIIDAIDAALDSLVEAAGGVGGLIKEFKDALASLA
jgi:hypothetical protein